MRVQNILTKVEYPLTKAEWDIIVAKKEAHKYKILDNTDGEAAKETIGADRQGLITQAKALETEKPAEALALYEKAHAIKATGNINKKIEALKKAIEDEV